MLLSWDTISIICQHANIPTLKAISETCKKANAIVNNQSLWQVLLKRDFATVTTYSSLSTYKALYTFGAYIYELNESMKFPLVHICTLSTNINNVPMIISTRERCGSSECIDLPILPSLHLLSPQDPALQLASVHNTICANILSRINSIATNISLHRYENKTYSFLLFSFNNTNKQPIGRYKSKCGFNGGKKQVQSKNGKKYNVAPCSKEGIFNTTDMLQYGRCTKHKRKVKSQPLKDLSKAKKLSVAQRLKLFVGVWVEENKVIKTTIGGLKEKSKWLYYNKHNNDYGMKSRFGLDWYIGNLPVTLYFICN